MTSINRGSVSEMLEGLASRPSQAFGVGYVSMPDAVTWVRRDGSQLMTADGPLDLSWAYDVRLFGSDGDLRWRWHETHGEWYVLDDAAAAGRGWQPLSNHAGQRRRLLRGSPRQISTAGWTLLWDGQAAPFDVPIQLNTDERAMITAIEYTDQDPNHGTVAVVAERYVSLVPRKETE